MMRHWSSYYMLLPFSVVGRWKEAICLISIPKSGNYAPRFWRPLRKFPITLGISNNWNIQDWAITIIFLWFLRVTEAICNRAPRWLESSLALALAQAQSPFYIQFDHIDNLWGFESQIWPKCTEKVRTTNWVRWRDQKGNFAILKIHSTLCKRSPRKSWV